MDLTHLAPLADVPNIRWYSLQLGPPAAQPRPPGLDLVDLSLHMADFADTAAILANLDLLISIDTAAAHLAGAMARPVWVLLPYSADWRWFTNRLDSPWYPTARLFRQPNVGDWASVVEQIASELQQHAGLP
jgi:hypothetical protein